MLNRIRLSLLGATIALLSTNEAVAISFDFIGTHSLSVSGVGALSASTLPFFNSATGSGPGCCLPYGEHSGEQIAPFSLRFEGLVRHVASAAMSSSGAFTLDAPTVVSIAGTATLLYAGVAGATHLDIRVQHNSGLENDLIVMKVVPGSYVINESAVLPAGNYTFLYSVTAPQVLDSSTYDFVLTIPEPSTAVLVGSCLLPLGLVARRRSSTPRAVPGLRAGAEQPVE